MRLDFNAPFNNGSKIFAEIHYNDGKQDKGLAVLANPSSWPFKALNYAFILHDLDVCEDGSFKTPHIHFVFIADKGQSKQNWINTLSVMFSVPKEAIGVQIMGSERASLRYLLHADNPEKHQYNMELCSSFPASWLEEAMKNKPLSNPTWEQVAECDDERELFNLVGMSNYQKAKYVWNDARGMRIRQDYSDAIKVEFDTLKIETIGALKRFIQATKMHVDVPGIRDLQREMFLFLKKVEKKGE